MGNPKVAQRPVSQNRAPTQAEAFGDWVFETDMPTAKIVLFPGLLRDRVLRSEGEVLMIGGRYRIVAHHGCL
nr:NAD(+)--dinitrogen-reductase ADP-D-ribosyltransferase [Rhodospira trueperi]